MTKLSSGWNLPPGCFERDLPGYYDEECVHCKQTFDARYGCDCKEATRQREAEDAAMLEARLDAEDSRYGDY